MVSSYEPNTIDFGDIDTEKRLDSIKVSFRRLAAGESVTVKYKVDDESSWVTVGTFNTVGELSYTFTCEASGDNFSSGKEFKFRFESTGGLEITGIHAKASLLPTGV